MSDNEARAHATEVLGDLSLDRSVAADTHAEIGSARGAAVSNFLFFASGAVIPVLPYLFGATGIVAVIIAAGLVGMALLVTGAIVGLLSGGPPLSRALRQLAIGFGAAGATYALGLFFGAVVN